METVIEVTLTTIMAVLLSINLIGLPGNTMLFVIAIIYSIFKHFETLLWYDLIILAVLLGAGELIELLGSHAMTPKELRTGKTLFLSIIGSLAGAIICTPVLPVIGTIAGSILGLSITLYVISRKAERNPQQAIKDSLKGTLGRIYGTAGKMVCGCSMLSICVYRFVTN